MRKLRTRIGFWFAPWLRLPTPAPGMFNLSLQLKVDDGRQFGSTGTDLDCRFAERILSELGRSAGEHLQKRED